VFNLITYREADFRVVGPTQPYKEQGGEYGLEALESSGNIWEIDFPELSSDEVARPKALLECRQCQTISMLRLSLVEVEVLEASGIVSRQCRACEACTPWGHIQKPIAMEAPLFEPARAEQSAVSAKGPERRLARRVALELPALVRDFYGGAEITQTENVSKGGFCFASDKNYYVGQKVSVACPYTAETSIEVPAQIVRRLESLATGRKTYGVHYAPGSAQAG
jgi:hypothetical protein